MGDESLQPAGGARRGVASERVRVDGLLQDSCEVSCGVKLDERIMKIKEVKAKAVD